MLVEKQIRLMAEKGKSVIFTDQEIHDFISEKKVLLKNKSLFKDGTLYGIIKANSVDLEGANGNKFQLRVRKSLKYDDNFSVIISIYVSNSNEIFRLRRYNGCDHDHYNPIEDTYIDFKYHIHQATERYQAKNYKKPDHFAESTTRYHSPETALKCLMEDCSISSKKDEQQGVLL